MSFLRDYQKDAVSRMRDGCILNGSVGSGKSRTALYFYFKENGGSIEELYSPMTKLQDLYIITTARKRDTHEWEKELLYFKMFDYSINIVIDSWNNIKKYAEIKDSFFIFDEDRVVGYGAWTKAFLKISKYNKWILLSATPGDRWEDYIPVFIANGFYRNKTEFMNEHIVWSRYTSFPKIAGYMNTGRLVRLRKHILVDMDFQRTTHRNDEIIFVDYDKNLYKEVQKNRWNPYKDEPIQNASEFCYTLRKVINSDPSRINAIKEIFNKRNKVIIFYNYDYELEILRNANYGDDVEIAEWNGWKHQEIPESEKWVYLVQYNAGSEGWNCILTDTIIFYSQNYSYRTLIQAAGRIDRLNTPFMELYYYHLKSRSGIDLAISKALENKKKFNEGNFYAKS